GLDFLLKKYASSRTLFSLAQLYDQFFPNQFYVDSALESFLQDKLNNAEIDDNIRRFFYRGDELLKKDERLPKVHLSWFIKKFGREVKKLDYQIGQYLFPFKSSNSANQKVLCNYDMSLYENSIFL